MCNSASLKVIQSLPAGLKTFWCGNNQLISLPSLPSSLDTLECFNTKITTIPELPVSLKTFWCGANTSLTVLPTLHSGLMDLDCTEGSVKEMRLNWPGHLLAQNPRSMFGRQTSEHRLHAWTLTSIYSSSAQRGTATDHRPSPPGRRSPLPSLRIDLLSVLCSDSHHAQQ